MDKDAGDNPPFHGAEMRLVLLSECGGGGFYAMFLGCVLQYAPPYVVDRSFDYQKSYRVFRDELTMADGEVARERPGL